MKWSYLIPLVLITTILCGCATPSSPPDTTPPPTITGLAASDAYDGAVVLSWEPSTAEDSAHYNVYQSDTEIINTTSLTPTQADITVTSYQVTGLEDETAYYFAVTAVDNSGNESLPVTISVIPGAKETLPPSTDTIPPETTIVSAPAETVTDGEVSFQWTGSDDITITAELVYSFMLEGHDTEYSSFTSETNKTYTDLPDGNYVFYVKAQDKTGNIDPTAATDSFSVATVITGGLLILRNSEVNRIAVGSDGKSIYALDVVNSQLYKSSHGGRGWVNISAGVSGAATWNELAVATDTPEIVAVVTNSRTEVCLSINGGSSFFSTGLAAKLNPGEKVQCLAISPAYGVSNRELTVGTSTGNGGGRVWVFTIPSTGWIDVSSGAPGWLPGVPAIVGTDVFAIEYSPSFSADNIKLAIVSSGPAPDTNDTYLYIGRSSGGTMTWNGNVAPGYPVEICQAGADTPGSPLISADLALPSDYNGSDIPSPHVYACWSDGPAGSPDDDVYRLNDTLFNRLYVSGGIISSIAHHGTTYQGKLLAGARTAIPGELKTQVYFTSNPHSGTPLWNSSLKPPTGPNEAQVAWSPDGAVAYCGTSTIGGASHDQSAFSVSTNDGLSWNQIGLIDT